MRKLIWLLPVFLMAMLVTGCLKDDPNEETIVLLGTESDVKLIKEVIPDTLLVFIADTSVMGSLTVDLPTGNTPPDIQGEYVFGPRILYKYNGDHPLANDTVFLRFGGAQALLQIPEEHHYLAGDILIQGEDTIQITTDTTIQVMGTEVYYPDGQNNKLVPCDIKGDILEKGNVMLKKQTPAYVVGRGSTFTAYFTVDYECEETVSGMEYTLKRGYILKGRMTQEGIEEAVLACVNIEAKPKGSSTTVPNEAIQSMENNIYIYRVRKLGDPEAFGTAKRYAWY